MLDQDRVVEAFKTALFELDRERAKHHPESSSTTLAKIAHRARQAYCRDLASNEKTPSLSTFRSFLFRKRSKQEILRLMRKANVGKVNPLERHRLLESFRAAIELGRMRYGEKLRPRTVAVMAHQHYCDRLSAIVRPPSLVSFTRRVKNNATDTEILALLSEAGIEPRSSARLNRERLKAAFGECIKKLENRIMKGIVKPLHVATGAHKIYVEGLDPLEQRPSRLTFLRMIYGEDADPEITSILVPHFSFKK